MKRQEKDLLTRYKLGQCTERERQLVESWHLQELKGKTYEETTGQLVDSLAKIKSELDEKIDGKRARIGYIRRARWVAASIIVFCVTSLLLYTIDVDNGPNAGEEEWVEADISPGGNKAVLVLGNGESVPLREDQGELVMDGKGDLQYGDGSHAVPEQLKNRGETISCTIKIPVGGQYKIVLSDGTAVWLNSLSVLKYPDRFVGKERIVELEGEAYFEVAKNEDKPFKVKSKGQILEVLGTSFNVSAYKGETTIKTTLVEGSVVVTDTYREQSVKLLPNEQSIVSDQAPIQKINVSPETSIAWKEGNFMFDNHGLSDIMSQLARWYDVEVEHAYSPKDFSIFGSISRSRNLQEVLNALERTKKIRFSVKGKRVIILKHE